MKTGDWVQIAALALVGFLAYEKFAKAKPPGSTVTPGLQPSKQTINTPLDPDFGLQDPSTDWDDVQGVSTLSDLIRSWL